MLAKASWFEYFYGVSDKLKIISEYMAFIGSRGGQRGGKTKGNSKRRSKEHYAKIAEIQRKRWAKYRAERQKK